MSRAPSSGERYGPWRPSKRTKLSFKQANPFSSDDPWKDRDQHKKSDKDEDGDDKGIAGFLDDIDTAIGLVFEVS